MTADWLTDTGPILSDGPPSMASGQQLGGCTQPQRPDLTPSHPHEEPPKRQRPSPPLGPGWTHGGKWHVGLPGRHVPRGRRASQRVSGHQKQADGWGPSISSFSHLIFLPQLKQVPLSAFSTPLKPSTGRKRPVLTYQRCSKNDFPPRLRGQRAEPRDLPLAPQAPGPMLGPQSIFCQPGVGVPWPLLHRLPRA